MVDVENLADEMWFPKNLECTRKKMWYGPQSKEMEAKPYFDARILVIHMKITIL